MDFDKIQKAVSALNANDFFSLVVPTGLTREIEGVTSKKGTRAGNLGKRVFRLNYDGGTLDEVFALSDSSAKIRAQQIVREDGISTDADVEYKVCGREKKGRIRVITVADATSALANADIETQKAAIALLQAQIDAATTEEVPEG